MEKHGALVSGNQAGTSLISYIRKFISVVTLIAIGCGLCSAVAGASAPAVQPKNLSIIEKCKADLAKRLKMQAQNIELVDAKAVTWPSAALGMPEIGRAYAPVKTPGQRLILQARIRQYLYLASKKSFKYGGPLLIWSNSMLYLRPVSNDPNLNRDLYQCSLLGTNEIRLLSQVSDYCPQDKGVIIAKRRMSRSSHDLLFVQANQPGKEKIIYHALDFGEAAYNADRGQWACIVRPRLGFVWVMAVGRVDEDLSKAKVLPMPEGMDMAKVAWSNDKLMIMTKKDDSTPAFEISPDADAPEWKPISAFYFPGYNRFVLSRSENLEVNQVKNNDKPGVEVVRVWFTGERREIAKIDDFTLDGYDLLQPFAFIWGEKGSHPVAYTVDVAFGDSVVSVPGKCSNIRPFAYPPLLPAEIPH